MSRPKTVEWRYVNKGTVAHALEEADDPSALCGVAPWDSAEWYGTGSQLEYERVEQLPCCRRCLRQLGVEV